MPTDCSITWFVVDFMAIFLCELPEALQKSLLGEDDQDRRSNQTPGMNKFCI